MFPSRHPNTIVCMECGYVGPSVVKQISKVGYFDAKEGYKTEDYDDDVDTCPYCNNHRILGNLVRKYDNDLKRFIISRDNEPSSKRPYVKERYLPNGRLYNNLEVSILKWKRNDEIANLRITLTNSYTDITKKIEEGLREAVINMLNKGKSKEECIRYVKAVREKAKLRGFTMDNIDNKVAEDLPNAIANAKAKLNTEVKALVDSDKFTERKKEYIKMKNFRKKLRNKHIYDALRAAAKAKGKVWIYDKTRSLYEQMKDYGIEGNLKMVDDIIIKKFFPNYGKRNHIEVNEAVCDKWDAVYHNGDAFANVWDGLTSGFESSNETVISRLAFALLSKAQKENALLIVRDKHVSVYERDLKRTLKYNKAVAEWYDANSDIMEDPSMSMDRSEAQNGIKIIDGVEHFFDPAWNDWIECDFVPSEGASKRFVTYTESAYDEFDDSDEEYVDPDFEYHFYSSEEDREEILDVESTYQDEEETEVLEDLDSDWKDDLEVAE